MANAGGRSVQDLFKQFWQKETIDLCRIRTYRLVDLSNEQVNANLIQLREYLGERATEFNSTLKNLKLTPFQWCTDGSTSTTSPTDEECVNSSYWVFGFRFGATNATKKYSIICHLDTVPASDSEGWVPFEPTSESKDYPSGTVTPQDFLVGRGCIDDKGPSISAFIVARALAKHFDESDLLNNTVVELIFDTSEETDMSTPYYLKDSDTVVPDFGVVYDAFWCVRAEKGGERPTFTIDAMEVPSSSLYINSLITPQNNSASTIPDMAEAEIRGDPAAIAAFATAVKGDYESFEFDDPDYRRAPLEVEEKGPEAIFLRTLVEGAQHGSAPEQNRAEGANPLVSLANFLAGMTSDGKMGLNAVAAMTEFIRWMWGTHVFGEQHSELYKYDEVFQERNGTTYAVTKSWMEETGNMSLQVDIRYAIPHHQNPWDGVTEGLLPGDESQFETIFGELVSKFNSQYSNYPDVKFSTTTRYVPDIRVPDSNPDYLKVEKAYKDVMGRDPPRFAIGGGTDAKGQTFLLAVGPLMDTNMGPPVNYHGIEEGVPVADLAVSTDILYNLMVLEVESPHERPSNAAELRNQSLKRVEMMLKKGHKFCCEC